MSIIATPTFSIIPTAGSASYPNKPAGDIQMVGAGGVGWPVDWSGVVAKNPPETASQPWEGVYYQGNWGGNPSDEAQVDPDRGDTVSNQSGPVNPTTVGRLTYNAANAPSPFGDALFKSASFNQLTFGALSGVQKHYISIWVKFSSNWFFPAGGMKLFNIWDSGGATYITEIRSAGSARAGYEGAGHTEPPYFIAVRCANGANNSYVDQIGDGQTEYYDDDPRMYNNVWYQLEYLMDFQTFFIEAFLNGVKVCDGTANANSIIDENTETSFDGTLGGQCTGCPELPASQYIYMDDWYMGYTTT